MLAHLRWCLTPYDIFESIASPNGAKHSTSLVRTLTFYRGPAHTRGRPPRGLSEDAGWSPAWVNFMDPKALERLHNSLDFLAFLRDVKAAREYWIRQLHDVKTESLQQISGRILAVDDILYNSRYEELEDRFTRLHSDPESGLRPFAPVAYQSDQSERSAPAASGTGTAERTSANELGTTRPTASAGKRRAAAHTAV